MSDGIVHAKSIPVVIQAFRWDGGAEKATPIINWILENGGTTRWDEGHREPLAADKGVITEWGPWIPEHLYILTLEGEMKANPGDWIIRGTRGEFYPCKPEVFAEKYKILEDYDDGTTPEA